MSTENETTLIEQSAFTLRVRPPLGTTTSPGLTLLLHGLSGSEDVMWVFAHRLKAPDWFIAPRALYPHAEGGYTWVPDPRGIDVPIDAYLPAVAKLLDLVDQIELTPNPNRQRIRLIGFSQGAALALAFTLAHPDRVERVVALAGYLPADAAPYLNNPSLNGLPIFMAHGTRDQQVPIEKARQAAGELEKAGAWLTFCEDEVGHKLSLSCLRGMEQFFRA